MMEIIYVEGNLLDGNDKSIAYGCNCTTIINDDIGIQIKELYPQSFSLGVTTITKRSSNEILGTFTSCPGTAKIVANLYIKIHQEEELDLNALETSLNGLCEQLKENNLLELGLPKFGGNWYNINKVIERVALIHSTIQITVYLGVV